MIFILFLFFLYFIFIDKEYYTEEYYTEGFKNNNELEICSTEPMTGYMRDGRCNLIEDDKGTHTVCAKVTQRFLEFSKNRGNDLITPRGTFPGLKEGDNWCLCALRWKEAYRCAEDPNCKELSPKDVPKIYIDGTHVKTLDFIEDLYSNEIKEKYSLKDELKDLKKQCYI